METTLVTVLSDEMVEFIMLKLPAKSLIRFKCVSKAWKHLISSHTFGEQWYKSSLVLPRDNPRDNFMVLRLTAVQICFTRLSVSHVDGKIDKSDTFRLPYISSGSGMSTVLDEEETSTVLDEEEMSTVLEETCIDSDEEEETCIDSDEEPLGLPLIYPAGFGFYCLFLFGTKKLALWNPTIRELKVLPWSPFNSKQKNKDEYVYGFAHVQYKEGVFSYKVGLMRRRYNASLNVVVTIELYSSSERCWRRLEDCCILEWSGDIYGNIIWPCKGTNLNGKFHFLNWFSRQDPYIVTFDIDTESFGRLEIPSFIRHDSDCNIGYSVLTKFDEKSLCLLLFRGLKSDHGGETYVDVWIMKKYGVIESWTKKGTTGPIIHPEYVDLLGSFSRMGGVFFQSREAGDGLFFCRYGSEKVETFLSINSEDVEIIQIVEYKENSIISFNGTSDQRTKRLTC